ncbi:MAG: gamma-glutamyl-gamma-aminobutyrate hydrolase family protein [Clostridium sp.]
MKKKIIGIVSSRTKFNENFRMGSFRSYIANDYVDRIAEEDAVPIILPLIKDMTIIREMIEICDGFILSGGDDLSPHLYNEEPTVYQGMIDELRDKIDFLIIEEAIKKNKGVLGICRGMQAINVYFGGSLYQDITFNKSYSIEHVQKSDKSIATHGVNIVKETNLHNILGDKVLVNSFHHQCIKELGENIIITARSNDGIIEGIELKNSNNIYGVQWHPEMMEDSLEMKKIFKYFIENNC